MKKTIMVTILIFIFMFTALLALNTSSTKDYKAIKKAVKQKKYAKTGDIAWFKILVTDNKTKKVKVRITLPISLIDSISECLKGDIKIKDKCSINLKKILKNLKKNGPLTIIEVNEDKETVKIWLE